MDKKFLSELDSKIKTDYRKWKNNLVKNPQEPHPVIANFGEIKYPLVQAEPHAFGFDKEKIWSQIPFAGTLLISLFNVPEKMSIHNNGFEPSDIPDLIRLSKETGKIRFTLQTDPLDYEGLDYLDPIFEEFNPTTQLTDHGESEKIDEAQQEKWFNEFFQIGSIRYLEELRYNVLKSGGNENFVKSLVNGRATTWERMKIMGMDEDIENLSNIMVDDPQTAESLFSAYIMITSPIFDPLTNHYNYSLSRLNAFNVNPNQEKSNIRIPEIGRLILNKLVLNPGSYYGCIETIQKYEDNDLYKLLESFEEGVSSKNQDKILKSKKDLEIIIDNVWNDVKSASSQIKGVKSGLSFALGVGSTFTASATLGVAAVEPSLAALAGLSGLFAGLGFNTFETHFGLKKNVSERIVSALKPNYLVNILDFTKKYDLK